MCVACTATALSSCVDTVILPDDITVGEDFWKTKNDVALMVNSAYEGMTTQGVMERLLIWGDFRADEMIVSNIEGDIPNQLAEIASVSPQVTNTFVSWDAFYSVINRCNIVLAKAGEVLAEDPNYTEGDYQTDCSQMLALRSLCYFYLVRNFRDVPYVDEPFMDSSKSRYFEQMTPAEVLQKCIESLETAAANSIIASSYSDSDWRRVGWFTRDGIHALLADIYLWRASVMHSDADYQKAIDYCNLVIDSKKAQHKDEGGTIVKKEYPLADGPRAYGNLFVDQNAEESVFELQVRSNLPLCRYLFKYQNNNSQMGFLKASGIFASTASTIASATTSNKVFAASDVRMNTTIFSHANDDEVFDIRKMVSDQRSTGVTPEAKTAVGRTYGGFAQNYIIYRLSDVMLMKAEAMVQQTANDTTGFSTEAKAAYEQKLREAFNLVQAVQQRSLLVTNGTMSEDSLKWGSLSGMKRSGKSGLEQLVMEERLRELCFEGKRWYDLMRYNYRHVDGVRYDALMADQGMESLPANYSEMLSLATRRDANQQAGLQAKMRNEAYLYLPIPNSDILLCPGLKQNPVYASSSSQQSTK